MKNYPSKNTFLQNQEKQPNTISLAEEKEGNKPENSDEEEKPKSHWDFNLSTIVSSTNSSSDTLGVTEFDPSGSILATGGIARKIRFYTTKTLLNHNENLVNSLDHTNACDYYICTSAKLSSLKWKPFSGEKTLGSGDYDGVVMEYDLEKRVPVFERDEHGGRRVWSIDYSSLYPSVVGASGSDDGTMQMWDTRCSDGGTCLGNVQPSVTRSSVCCVEFNPFNGAFLAVACADRRVYLYDTRKIIEPVIVFDGHNKPVTYVKFLDYDTIVTSAIDGCLKMWNTDEKRVVRTYRGHVNARRFVGLSVWKNGGLLSCGSESNQVFVYDMRWGEPIWVYGFEPVAQAELDYGFVSSVCWRQAGEDECTLVAGGSNGVLQVFNGRRR